MHSICRQFAAVLLFCFASVAAHSEVVVDTGTPSEPYGWSFGNTQYFAGEFSFSESLTLDSIEGYFGTRAGDVLISVHADGGVVPGATQFSTSLITTEADTAWNGVSGLGWTLAAGTYWVSFKPSFEAGVFNSMPGGAPDPLLGYALFSSGNNDWASFDGANVGIRMSTASAVPEPSSLLMYGIGILALGVLGRRRLK